MCTLIVLHRCIPGRPLVVAANRDEFYARPAEDFAIRESGTGPILSPLDLEAGGTWVGLSRRGVFAGLTNLRPLTGFTGVEAARSRGEIVMAALEAESAADALRALMDRLSASSASVSASTGGSERAGQPLYSPFQLLVADGRDAWLIVYRDGPRAVELEPGPHVVGNVESESVAAVLGSWADLDERRDNERGSGPVGVEDPAWTTGFEGLADLIETEEPRALKLTRIRERVEKMMTNPGQDLFEGLARICREHLDEERLDALNEEQERRQGREQGREQEPGRTEQDHQNRRSSEGSDAGVRRSPFEATCVHVADRYGTRSAMLLELSRDSKMNRLWTTSGPPCVRPFENRSSLLEDLGVRLGDR